jgi:hypothetical protein
MLVNVLHRSYIYGHAALNPYKFKLVSPVTHVTEYFITHIIGLRTLPSMSKQVFLNVILHTESFTTHITGIRTLSSMCQLVYL